MVLYVIHFVWRTIFWMLILLGIFHLFITMSFILEWQSQMTFSAETMVKATLNSLFFAAIFAGTDTLRRALTKKH